MTRKRKPKTLSAIFTDLAILIVSQGLEGLGTELAAPDAEDGWPALMNQKQAYSYLGMKRDQFTTLGKEGRILPPVSVRGGHKLYRKIDLDKFVLSLEAGAPATG